MLLPCPFTTLSGDFTALVADRAAIERVYYQHRLGAKLPFEQTLPRTTLEALVKLDLKKEAALKHVYGLETTPTPRAAEVQRINTTTPSPPITAALHAPLRHVRKSTPALTPRLSPDAIAATRETARLPSTAPPNRDKTVAPCDGDPRRPGAELRDATRDPRRRIPPGHYCR